MELGSALVVGGAVSIVEEVGKGKLFVSKKTDLVPVGFTVTVSLDKSRNRLSRISRHRVEGV